MQTGDIIMPLDLNIDLETIENKVIVRLTGRIDAVTVPALEKKLNTLIDENHIFLLLDFSKIDYLSSAGLRLLLSKTKKLKAKNGFFVLFSINEDILEIIKIAGFERVLNICSIEKDALQFKG